MEDGRCCARDGTCPDANDCHVAIDDQQSWAFAIRGGDGGKVNKEPERSPCQTGSHARLP